MQTLPETFRYDSYDFTQIKRVGNVALFSKHKAGHTQTHYEVFIVQQHPAETIRGIPYPEREKMPHTETWGTLGFTPYDLPAAERRFNELVKRSAMAAS
jgi:hypothetical protein